MASIRVAVLGASGIGRFHVREFLRAGTDVVSILGSSSESAQNTATAIAKEFGTHPRAYSDLDTLLEEEKLDAVSICTPPRLHFEQIKQCLNAKLHVLCEKPLVYDGSSDTGPQIEKLFRLAQNQDRILSVNTQWPSVLPVVSQFVDLSDVKSFSFSSQPGEAGVEMLFDHLPHANSMLVKMIPRGRVADISFEMKSSKAISVSFDYHADGSVCHVSYLFQFKKERPRDLAFAINDVTFEREIKGGYSQALVVNGEAVAIEDPFKTSISKFVSAIQGEGAPLVSEREIIENAHLQDALVAAFMTQFDQ